MKKFKLLKKQSSFIIALIALFGSVFFQAYQNRTRISPNQTKNNQTLTASQSAGLIKVVRVIDGDTIELENKQKVRYIGIDSPELHDPRKPVQCFAREALEKNKGLVEGKDIRLEKDVSETDRYGRLLRYVYLPGDASPSGEFINGVLVREGYAHAVTFPPDVKFTDLFRVLENEARRENRGLWKDCK